MGGTLDDIGYGLTLDTSDNVYSTGYFRGAADFDPGDMTTEIMNSIAGSQDIFVSKLDTSGDFVWAKSMGGALNDNGYGISVDTSGNAHITGYFQGTVDFDPGIGTFNLASIKDSDDIFIVLLSGPPAFPWFMFLPAITGQTAP